MAATAGSYQHRFDEWTLQAQIAQGELGGTIDFAHRPPAEELIDAHAADMAAGTEHTGIVLPPAWAPNEKCAPELQGHRSHAAAFDAWAR